jgi:Mrp family chromosome partitioning ATPase/capsular polysaccharide biosynthesis protein
MDPLEYLNALRRRWPVVAITFAVALLVGWMTTTTVIPIGPPQRTFQAKTLILNTGQLNVPGITGLPTVATLTTVGEVPVRVAEKIGYEGHPSDLAAKVSASAGREGGGLLEITATSNDAREAKLLADTFAEEVIAFLQERKSDLIAQQMKFYNRRLEQLQAEIEALEEQIAGAPAGELQLLNQTHAAKLQIFGFLSQQSNALVYSAAEPGTLLIVQRAEPQEIVQSGFQPPSDRTGRLILAGIIGLVLGGVLALLIDRVDVRIRERGAAEQHFDLPVLSEIPTMRRHQADGLVETAERPTSPPAEAFRLLGMTLSQPSTLNGSKGTSAAGATRSPLILVTSPGPREGKSTVVANLAAAFSGIGESVLVLSCDFRQPTVHKLLGTPNGFGLTDALETAMNGDSRSRAEAWEPGVPESAAPHSGSVLVRPSPLLARERVRQGLTQAIRQSPLSGVMVVASGSHPETPSALLTSGTMRQVLAEARRLGRMILIDTPPLLDASDAAHLFPEVDAVLIVARAGKTTVAQAQRTATLLKRLNAPAVGVVLNGARGMGARYRFPRLRLPRRG